MGKLSRMKGKRFEQQVARDLRERMPGATIARSIQSRAGGSEGSDVKCPGWFLECKHGQLPSPRAALAQAERDSEGKGLFVAAIIKDNRRTPFVCMPYDDWLQLMELIWALQETQQRG